VYVNNHFHIYSVT